MSQHIPVRDLSPDPVRVHTPQPAGQPVTVDLYARREKIHVRSTPGFFQNIRVTLLYLTLALFFLLPWLQWDGRQAVLFDLSERHFHIFAWTFLPEDFFFLSWLFIIAAFALFAVTVFAGRVWCGYACPQTVWTLLFMWIEEMAEGGRNARMRLDKAAMGPVKLLRRAAKHGGWFVVAFFTGLACIGYFTPVRDFWDNLSAGQLGFWTSFWLVFFTLATYVNAGWMREQICLHICPYGRFQSVMFDKDTLIISYDSRRGDPRGSRRRDSDAGAQGLGDCIDCNMCVQVCPTGIDIRDGLQFECIQCAACVDACDSVMDQMGYARGLVRYTTENLLEQAGTGRYRFLRPSLLIYSAALVIMSGALVFALVTRTPLSVESIRDRGALFRESAEGMIQNSYTLKIQNKAQSAGEYRVSATCDSFRIRLDDGGDRVHLAAGELATLPVMIEADPADITTRSARVSITVTRVGEPGVSATTENSFLSPRL